MVLFLQFLKWKISKFKGVSNIFQHLRYIYSFIENSSIQIICYALNSRVFEIKKEKKMNQFVFLS